MIVQLPGWRPFLAAFERAPAHFGHWSDEAFRRWLATTWAFVNAIVDRPAFDAIDQQTPRDDAAWWAQTFEQYLQLTEQAEQWEDILGPVYQELRGGRQRAQAGQFFTPWDVAKMMAAMNIDVAGIKTRRGTGTRYTVCNPAVGSGVMLLAFAAAVRDHPELGYPYLDTIDLYGQDVDPTCVLMTQVQLRVHGLDAVGRSLRVARVLTRAHAGAEERDGPRLLLEVTPPIAKVA